MKIRITLTDEEIAQIESVYPIIPNGQKVLDQLCTGCIQTTCTMNQFVGMITAFGGK